MTEIDNSLSEYLFALKKDAPGKVWWNAGHETRAPVYRALRIDPGDTGAAYATTPFRLTQIEGRWLILAAYPAPAIFDPAPDWLDIETVLAWEPNSDAVEVLGDDAPQLVGRLTDDANTIYASPRIFFQSWAIRRARFFVQRQTTQGRDWHIVAQEGDDTPGALVIGAFAKIRLNPSAMPETVLCDGLDPKELNRAIMRAARLPRVSAAQHVRRAP